MKEEMICLVEVCERPAYTKKHMLCHPHYLRYLKYGDPGKNPIKDKNKIIPYVDIIKLSMEERK